MSDPTGRWLNRSQWRCPRCGWVNGDANQDCQKCARSVRPPADEPVRPPDPLDLIGYDETRAGDGAPVRLAAKAAHTLTRVTREQAMALIGEGLRNGLRQRGEPGDRAWQAITDLSEDDRRAAIGSLVDDLEEGGFALYRIRDGERG